jgi:hypothetical protein
VNRLPSSIAGTWGRHSDKARNEYTARNLRK